jgi:hypothetical protein
VRTTRKIWRTSENASSNWKAISLPWSFVIGRGSNSSTRLLTITIQCSKEQAKENAARSPGRRVMVEAAGIEPDRTAELKWSGSEARLRLTLTVTLR